VHVLKGRAAEDNAGHAAPGEPHPGQRRGLQHRAGQVAPFEAHVAAAQPAEVATGEVRVDPDAFAQLDLRQARAHLDVAAGLHAFPLCAGLETGWRRVEIAGNVGRFGCPLPRPR